MKTSFKQDVVNDLLLWLEERIHTPLSIDDFVEKSGYSKWHLQRIFKEVTGQKLASYSRLRRLTSSAIMLRLFDKQIDVVGSEHGFSSHNVFHKTFKRHFQMTPAQYRDALHWSCKGLCPPINLSDLPVPQGKLVMLEEKRLLGELHEYPFTYQSLNDFAWTHRIAYWQPRLAELDAVPQTLYGLVEVIRGGPRGSKSKVHYVTGIWDEETTPQPGQVEYQLKSAPYLHFAWQGAAGRYPDFLRMIYKNSLPETGVVRRDGCDIERIRQPAFSGSPDALLIVDYYVPVLP